MSDAPVTTQEWWARLCHGAIPDNAEALSPILMSGRVAVFVHEVGPDCEPLLRYLGWDGNSTVFAMSSDVRLRYAHRLALVADKVSARWLRRKANNRIFVVSGRGGTILLNMIWAEKRYEVEPGSTNAEMAAFAN